MEIGVIYNSKNVDLIRATAKQSTWVMHLVRGVGRSDESVVVGGQCGGAQIYYQELGARGAGPPPPSDVLAAAPLRARRRLQRDHATLLL